MAGLRRRRSLRPTGTGYHAWFRVDDSRRPAVPLFRSGAAQPALLRFSRAAGLPKPLPEALGVAIKLPDAHGPSADRDLLLDQLHRPAATPPPTVPATGFVRGGLLQRPALSARRPAGRAAADPGASRWRPTSHWGRPPPRRRLGRAGGRHRSRAPVPAAGRRSFGPFQPLATLGKLGQLLTQGLLTEEEFALAKRELLGEL